MDFKELIQKDLKKIYEGRETIPVTVKYADGDVELRGFFSRLDPLEEKREFFEEGENIYKKVFILRIFKKLDVKKISGFIINDEKYILIKNWLKCYEMLDGQSIYYLTK